MTNSQPTVRARIRNTLAALGVIAVFLAVMPYCRYEGGVTADAKMADHILVNPGSMPFTEEYRFGWGDSPLVHYRCEQTLAVRPDGAITSRRTSGARIGWLSWSSLTLGLGVTLLWGASKLRSKVPPLVEAEAKPAN